MATVKRSILSTRALSDPILAGAKKKKVSVEIKSFIRVELIKSDELIKKIKKYSRQKIVAVFTSHNALQAVTERIKYSPDWQVYCTSGKTQFDAVTYFGVHNVLASAKNAKFLCSKILKNPEVKKVVFFCGDQRMDTLPNILTEKGIEVEEVIVYETTITPQVVNDKKHDAILFFSPSAVESFFSVNKVLPDTLMLSIGQTTAEMIRRYCDNEIKICKDPSEEALLAMIIKGKKY